MKKFISLGYLSLKLLFPFLTPIFSCLRSYVNITVNPNPEDESSFLGFTFFLAFLLFLCEILCGLLELLSVIRQQTTKSKLMEEEKKTSQNQTEESALRSSRIASLLVPVEKGKKTNKYLFYYLFAATFVDFFSFCTLTRISLVDKTLENVVDSEIRIIQIVFISVLSKIFLHYPFHRHHAASLTFIAVGMILICLKSFSNITPTTENIINTILYLVCYLLYVIQDIIEKYVMEKEYISPFRLLLYEGIIGMGISLVAFILSFCIPFQVLFKTQNTEISNNLLSSLGEVFTSINNNKIHIAFYALFLFSSCGYNLFIVLTNYYFYPSHINVSDTLSLLAFWLLLEEEKDIGWYHILKVVGFILIFIGGLIYNEIIIVYFFGLGEYTRKEIRERAAKIGEVNFEEVEQL